MPFRVPQDFFLAQHAPALTRQVLRLCVESGFPERLCDPGYGVPLLFCHAGIRRRHSQRILSANDRKPWVADDAPGIVRTRASFLQGDCVIEQPSPRR